MAVRLSPPSPEALLAVAGIALGAAAAKIKNWTRNDVVLIAADVGTVGAGVFTQNRFCAAPVIVCRAHLNEQRSRHLDFRGLVINAGNANAGTGDAGLEAARGTCARVASLLDCEVPQILPFSTGVIMEPLPVDRVVGALPDAYKALRSNGWLDAAKAIMTTDTVPKAASRRVMVDNVAITVTGIAKGAGMIHPNMATLLAFIATDAPIDSRVLAELSRSVADASFNTITVDGDTSTNDSFVIAATGRAPIAPLETSSDSRFAIVKKAIEDVAVDLAQAIVRDGEGATKFIAIHVAGGRDAIECRRVALAIAHSPLVKTAFFASDPNLGRIVSAIGNAGITDLDPTRVSFWLDDVGVVDRGGRSPHYREEEGQRVMKQDEITIRVDLGRGDARASVWTCDLSHDYVSINADYRT